MLEKNKWSKINGDVRQFLMLNGCDAPLEAEFVYWDGEVCPIFADYTGYSWMDCNGDFFDWRTKKDPHWIMEQLDELIEAGGQFRKREIAGVIEYFPIDKLDNNPRPFFSIFQIKEGGRGYFV